MRLIDADALTTEILGMRYTEEAPSVILTQAGQEIFNSGIEAANFAVHDAPTIDAVPVVRCKDCIHAVDITNYRMAKRFGDHAKQCMRYRGDSGFGYFDLSVVYPDGFCDEGARMDGEAGG